VLIAKACAATPVETTQDSMTVQPWRTPMGLCLLVLAIALLLLLSGCRGQGSTVALGAFGVPNVSMVVKKHSGQQAVHWSNLSGENVSTGSSQGSAFKMDETLNPFNLDKPYEKTMVVQSQIKASTTTVFKKQAPFILKGIVYQNNHPVALLAPLSASPSAIRTVMPGDIITAAAAVRVGNLHHYANAYQVQHITVDTVVLKPLFASDTPGMVTLALMPESGGG